MIHSMISDFEEDVDRLKARVGRASLARIIGWTLLEPGLQFMLLLRLQLMAESAGWRMRARILHLINLRLTGGEVGHGSSIGGGLVVKHPLGVVLGAGVTIGRGCTILPGVTLGEKYVDLADGESGRCPSLADGVVVGVGASILGPVRVGAGAVVGAHAVVLNNVAADVTVAGAPARPVRSSRGAV